MNKLFNVEDIFTVKSGDYHALQELDPGNIPLISCGDENSGFVGAYDIPKNKRYSNTITVAYNGQPLTAKYHPYEFGAKDDVAVLLPKKTMSYKTLVYIASLFNKESWRYSYGRKCFKAKLLLFKLSLPINNKQNIDQNRIEKLYKKELTHLMPQKSPIDEQNIPKTLWKSVPLSSLFKFERGHFHSISDLAPGTIPTVSRISSNNGIVGCYEKPDRAKLYPKGLLTVSTVTGDTFVQKNKFIATDNVVICIPKAAMKLHTLYFIQMMINQTKWRYSYGRQCYKTKFQETKIFIPTISNGKIDQTYIESIINANPFWNCVKKNHAKGG
jgi:hypothetical protein